MLVVRESTFVNKQMEKFVLLPPEVEEVCTHSFTHQFTHCTQGNIEYKLKLANSTPERFEQLVTQLKWRLAEGHGEAMYRLGVSDAGVMIGLNRAEMDESLKTLKAMADKLGAEISIVRERNVDGSAREEHSSQRTQRQEARRRFSESTRKTSKHAPVVVVAQDDNEDDKGDDAAGESELVVAEVMVRRTTDSLHFLEVRLLFLGATGSGKSSLISYLSYNQLDDGFGRARLHLLRHRHEVETGRTSSISHSIVGFNSKGELLNYGTATKHLGASCCSPSHGHQSDPNDSAESENHQDPIKISGSAARRIKAHSCAADAEDEKATGNWCESQIVDYSSKILMLIDTCGHPKYIKTTLQGLTGYNPDYAAFVIDGLSGSVDATAREVLGCAMILSIPVFVVVTKIDMAKTVAEKQKLQNTVGSLLKLLMLPGNTRIPVVIQDEDGSVVAAQNFVSARVTPVFLVSNVSGDSLDLLVKFLNLLPSRGSLVAPGGPSTAASEDPTDIEFHIEEVYSVPSVGPVVGGRLARGTIQSKVHVSIPESSSSVETTDKSNNRKLFLGPVDKLNGKFIPIELSSVHRQRRPCSNLVPGQSATLALLNVDRDLLRKGMVILGSEESASACMEFEAEMLILYAPDDYSLPYGPVKTQSAATSTTSNNRKRRISMTLLEQHLEGGDKEKPPRKHIGFLHIGNIYQLARIIHASMVQTDDTSSSDGGSEKNSSSTATDTHIQASAGNRLKIRFRFANQKEFVRRGMRVLFREESQHCKMAGEVL